MAGFVTPPTDALYDGERMSIVGDEGAPSSGWGTVSNHDELMSNFFAQVSQQNHTLSSQLESSACTIICLLS